MKSVRRSHGAAEKPRRGTLSQAVALMGPLLVVEPHEGIERALHCRSGGEVLAPEVDAPVLVQDRAPQALDEAVGRRMSGPGARVANAQRPAGVVEGTQELRAPVGQHPLQWPTRAARARPQDPARNSSLRRSMTLVVRSVFHCAFGKVKNVSSSAPPPADCARRRDSAGPTAFEGAVRDAAGVPGRGVHDAMNVLAELVERVLGRLALKVAELVHPTALHRRRRARPGERLAQPGVAVDDRQVPESQRHFESGQCAL